MKNEHGIKSLANITFILAIICLVISTIIPFAVHATSHAIEITSTGANKEVSEPPATLRLVNYKKNDQISYECVQQSSSGKPITWSGRWEDIGNVLAGLVYKTLSPIFGVNEVPLDEADAEACTGSGGQSKGSIQVMFSNGEATVIDRETSAPRYGSRTCATSYQWSPATGDNIFPWRIEDSCEKTAYVCSQYYDPVASKGKSIPTPTPSPGYTIKEDCPVNESVALVSYMIPIGNGSITDSKIIGGTLLRTGKLSLSSKMNLEFNKKDKGPVEVVLLANVYKMIDIPRITVDGSYEVLGAHEFQIAGKDMQSEYDPVAGATSLYVKITGKPGQVIDVTPKVRSKDVKLSTYDLRLVDPASLNEGN